MQQSRKILTRWAKRKVAWELLQSIRSLWHKEKLYRGFKGGLNDWEGKSSLWLGFWDKNQVKWVSSPNGKNHLFSYNKTDSGLFKFYFMLGCRPVFSWWTMNRNEFSFNLFEKNSKAALWIIESPNSELWMATRLMLVRVKISNMGFFLPYWNGFISQNCGGKIFSHHSKVTLSTARCYHELKPWRRRRQAAVGGWCFSNDLLCEQTYLSSYFTEAMQLWNCFWMPTNFSSKLWSNISTLPLHWCAVSYSLFIHLEMHVPI